MAQIGAAIGREFSHSLLAAVVDKPEEDLAAALDRLIKSGLLLRQSIPPHATYLFKHALVQDAAYGTLLRERRRALHARIAGTLEALFADIAESQPELLARHCTEAGRIEKAAHLWGRAAQRSVERSALVEAIAQFTRGLDQMETLPTTPALRREEIELQVALITPLIHVKGYAAPETTEAVERARLLIEKAEALGEPPEDPLLLFSVLYGLWVVKLVALDGDEMRQLATQFLELAEKHGRTPLLMMGHRLTGVSLMLLGDIAQSRTHLDEAIALYNPATDRPLAARFGQDPGITSLRLSGKEPMVPRLSRCRPRRCRACGQGCPRNRSSCDFDARAVSRIVDPSPLWRSTRPQISKLMNLLPWRMKRRPPSGRRKQC